MNEFIKKNSMWLGAIAIVIVAVVIWAIAASGPSLNINKTVQSKCLSEVNDKTFCKFAGVFANAGDYKAVMTQTSESGTIRANIAIGSGGNATETVIENGQTSADIVVYNNTTYVKDPSDNQWIQYASASTNKPEVSDIRKSLVNADFKNDQGQKETYVNKGTEFTNGYNCIKYQVLDPAKTATQGYIWFDKSNYLLRKLTSSDPTSGNLTMTFTYGNVSISQPSPIKAITQ